MIGPAKVCRFPTIEYVMNFDTLSKALVSPGDNYPLYSQSDKIMN